VEPKDHEVLADALYRDLGLRDDFTTSDTAFSIAGTA